MVKPETEKAIDELLNRYPIKEAALLPALHKVQDDFGWLPVEAMDWVADRLELPHARVYGVTSFYTMFRREKLGRHRLEICTNLSCSLMGAEHLREYLCNKLNIKPGQTTADGRITLLEAECLGSCGTAPVMLVDDEFFENLDPDKVDQILKDLEAKDNG
ncbi:MAG: NADH-quinone oxidoreductase subunit NuoE [Deltaproteobacteria bacterium]|nr:NADH-quinone oxidoreductase subunit NuoE [Deltaproteobacteria bacterium]MBW1872690.1 NADH-quinone oxidoreductase subunit NuoE [Deltaproteobacteria bacterium]